jgi:non-canonical poly(A) RNA polymerase PAPD5/7
MKPTHTRLTCRAHNRFSPSIALWQYFVGPDRPFLSQQRHSLNVPRAVQTGASKDNDQLQSPASADLPRSDAQVEKDSGTPDSGKVVKPQLKIRRKRTGKGIWHENKVDASIAKNIKTHHVIRQATMDALLAEARVAFKASEDYIGRAVEPKMHPTYVKESQLPWTLSASKSTMQGIDRSEAIHLVITLQSLTQQFRLAIEIDRFYEYTQPNHYEQIARKHLIEQVQRNVLKTLPNHVLETFGSERTGLALPTSDIDLRLTTKERMEDPAMSRLPPSSTERLALRRTLTKLYWQEMRLNTTYTSVEFRQARYPLISLQDEQSGLDVQIVLNNDTSLSREFTNKYLEEYPYLRQLYFVIKTIFDMRGLTDVFTGGIGSYSLFMMIVASIRGLPHKRHDAAGGLLNFLRFYSNFDCTKNGIQIEPWWIFDKAQHSVLTDKVVKQLKVSMPAISRPPRSANSSVERHYQTPPTIHAQSPRPGRRNQRSRTQSHSHKTLPSHGRST